MTTQRNLIVCTLSLGITALLAGCMMGEVDGYDDPGMPVVGAIVQESQCGPTQDFQDVELYDGTLGVTRAFVDRHQGAVGQIQWKSDLDARYSDPGNVSGVRWCSGTLLPDNVFLTAGHCFNPGGGGWQYPRHADGTLLSAEESATEMIVNFNYQLDSAGNPRNAVSFTISALLEHNLNGLDYAIIQLEGNPGAQFPHARVATSDAVAGDMLSIIEHPNGMRKQIDAGPVSSLSGSKIYYGSIDTLGGSSGSGILQESTGRLVGVHTNGGCTETGGNNSGVRISSLLNASAILQAVAETSYVDGVWKDSGGRSTTDAGNPRFALHVGQSGNVQLDLESTVDTYLYLLNASGTLLYSDDDSGNGYNSRLETYLAAGDYIVVAATFSTARSGEFELASSGGELSALVEDSWSSSGGRNASAASNPRVVLSLRYQADIELNLMSSVDTYLYLLDAAGNQLAADDDGGDGSNSRITMHLDAGEYVVVAATYSSGQSGSFDLTSSHGTLRGAPASFARVVGDGACPAGTFLASRADVTSDRPSAESQLATWDIARLTEGWALRGPGYGYDFKLESVTLGHTLCASY